MRSLILIVLVVALSATALAIPEIRVFGLQRGDTQNIVGLTLGLDLQGGTHLVYQMVPEDGRELTQDDADAIRTIIDRRVNEFGVSEATVQLLGGGGTGVPDRILVQIPGQSGASVTVKFDGDPVTPESLQQFFREDLGKTDAKVTQNDDGSLTIRFDELRPAVIDADGNVVEPGEGESFREPIESHFSVGMTVFYLPRPVEGSDPEDEDPETELPTLEDVQAAFEAAGRGDAEITQSADTQGLFNAEMYGGLAPQTVDDEGNVVPGDESKIRDALDEIGDLALLFIAGDITHYIVGGGVQEAKELIGSTAQLEFRERICGAVLPPSDDVPWPPDGLTPAEWQAARCEDPRYYEEIATDIEASDLVDAFAGTQPNVAGPVVNIQFNSEGADAFFRVTDRISRTGDRLAIYLDGQELVSPGVDRQVGGIAGGRAFISGNFTGERARTIAIQLRSGALPTDLQLIQERNVDATLGSESLRKSLIAGTAGLALLLVFLVAYYKVPGLVASVSLVGYTVVLIAIFKLLPVTLTLSGAAAVILTLGFAVDANILISERIKEELRTGRTLLGAIDAGFNRAWPSIRDGNLSTIIIALVLFWFGDRFGTSIMQGFALTLGIGVLLSMVTAFVASRVFLRLAARSPLGKQPNLFTPVVESAGEELAVGS